MNKTPPKAGRALALLAAACTAILGVALAASPAAAQAPVPAEVTVFADSPIYAGNKPEHFGIRVDFGSDFEPGEHEVAATLEVDAPDNTFFFGFEDTGLNGECPVNDAHTVVECSRDAAEAGVLFEFLFGAAETAEPGDYGYSVTIAVDGETVDTVDGSIEILPAADDPASEYPYLHGDVAFTGIDPGASVDVAPKFLQDGEIPADAEAVVLVFSGPQYVRADNSSIEVLADYDNCLDGSWNSAVGVTCVVTDFYDLPGKEFTISDPITYAVSSDAPGPVAVCGCEYGLMAVGDEALEAWFGGVFWDEGSDNLLELEETASIDPEYGDSTFGVITIETTDNPYDLGIADANVKGQKGDKVTVTVPVTNGGPASADAFFDGPGSYVVIGQLPSGLDLLEVDEDGWICLDKDDFEYYLPVEDPEKLDFACYFDSLDPDASIDLSFTVEITDASASDDGRLEVIALENDGYPGVIDRDLKNNVAKISVNASGSGKLPTTGASMTAIAGGAALAVALGAALFMVSRRRRIAEH